MPLMAPNTLQEYVQMNSPKSDATAHGRLSTYTLRLPNGEKERAQ